jgi:SpoVK/Ycf46/Vps4 family AAA+-type ATPase
MLCRSRTRGYSLKMKKWLDFFVEQVTDIKWNTEAFDKLVLPTDQKELILAFSESQLEGSSFDDIISGKGKGIICLLSGPPGVGKTLTAEAVAENLRVPLHTLSSGDLGSQPWEVENGLSSILDLVARWNAILLLDECDVFLEARSTHDLERNKVVSIFLRTLEYYEGIMFMTTNRVDNIDPAFQSRIHVSLDYPDLTTASRRQIWRNFLQAATLKSELTDKDIDELAELKLNGRQIKNVLKTAQLLASRRKTGLKRSFIDVVLATERRRPAGALQ